MSHYIGIDVSCKSCAVCAIGADDGKIKARGQTETTVEAIHAFIQQKKLNAEVIGLETGTECHHLARGLSALGHRVEIIEARKSARIISMLNANKNDPNDAFALAQLLRSKFYTSVRVKAPDQLDLLALVNARRHAVEIRTGIGNQIRGMAKAHGFKLEGAFNPDAWQEALTGHSAISEMLSVTLKTLVNFYKSCSKTIAEFDQQIRQFTLQDEKVRLLQTTHGVGPILAITYFAHFGSTPAFTSSRSAGAFVGLTPMEFSSGETIRRGGISKRGPEDLRRLLVQAAMTLLVNVKKDSLLKRWGKALRTAKGLRLAAIAVARKLAVILYCILRDHKPFDAGIANELCVEIG